MEVGRRRSTPTNRRWWVACEFEGRDADGSHVLACRVCCSLLFRFQYAGSGQRAFALRFTGHLGIAGAKGFVRAGPGVCLAPGFCKPPCSSSGARMEFLERPPRRVGLGSRRCRTGARKFRTSTGTCRSRDIGKPEAQRPCRHRGTGCTCSRKGHSTFRSRAAPTAAALGGIVRNRGARRTRRCLASPEPRPRP